MPRTSKKCPSMSKLVAMAREYGVDKNALFMATLYQYNTQLEVIQSIRQAIDENQDITTEKTYVKGETNTYMHPAVKELPRHAEAANKTASQLLDIILKLGRKKEASDLEKFLSGSEDV